MTMLTQHVALVSESKSVKTAAVRKVAAALQKQASRDLAPVWDVDALVGGFAKLEDVPLGHWPIIVMDDVENAAGYHQDENGQPFAVVEAGASWALTASHECLEMLVDPFGRRLVAGPSPKAGQGRVQFLVEVCDPCEDERLAYEIDGVAVSDFYTPNFFDAKRIAGARYSFTGAVTKPREVLRGGYLSWQVPKTKHWWQQSWFGARSSFTDLGVFDDRKSLREQVDERTLEFRAVLMGRTARRRTARALAASNRSIERTSWADSLREQIASYA